MRFIKYLAISLFVIAAAGCTSVRNQTGGPDETGQKVIIGYVNTDPFYLVSIEKRMSDVLAWLRAERSIFFQPSPDDLLKLSDVCLDREIRKTGLSQPGMDIDKDEKNKIAIDMGMEKGNRIVERLKQGAKLDDVANELGFRAPKKPQRVHKGDNPDYDNDIFGAEEGSIIGPIAGKDRLLIFIVEKRGKESDGSDWVDIYAVNFGFPVNDAQKVLENKIAETWNIRISDGFYSAIRKFYSQDIEGAQNDIETYLKKGGSKNPLAHYLMYKIISEQEKKQNNGKPSGKALINLEKAINASANPKLTPYFRFYLGLDLLNSGDGEKAKAAFRAAFDELHSDIFLVKQLNDIFNRVGDTEYADKSLKKKMDLEEQLKNEKYMTPRKPESKEVVMTGEGPLNEDPEEIWKEKEEKTDKK